MAKPEPLPVIKGKDAKALAERLEKRQARPEAKHLFAGAVAEYRAAEGRRSRSIPSTKT